MGINAGKVTNLNLRKAIMSAMNPNLVSSFYEDGTVTTIAWPMSIVSWAYPRANGFQFNGNEPLRGMKQDNGAEWTQFTVYRDDQARTDQAAKDKIQRFMAAAGVSAGDSRLKMKFTIAGTNLNEHPVYRVFEKAAELLNSCGWDVEVVPDTNALNKLATGSLTVWAAAWGSTVDPDMYQVYHKNSTATSVLNWGYREILNGGQSRSEEQSILNELSRLVDEGRESDDEATRAATYELAMREVLKLAVEMPIYQRKTLYAYNSNVIDESTFPETINSYSSPLNRIWEIDFVK